MNAIRVIFFLFAIAFAFIAVAVADSGSSSEESEEFDGLVDQVEACLQQFDDDLLDGPEGHLYLESCVDKVMDKVKENNQ